MKKIISIIFLLLSMSLFSEENYNIGDKISLKIEGKINKEEIEKDFENYNSVSITNKEKKLKNFFKFLNKNEILNKEEDEKNSFIVDFTTYKIGENKVVIGDKKLKFNVKSTIDENENEIYEELANEKNKYIEQDYPHKVIVSVFSGILIIITSITIILIERYRNPYVIFKKSMSKVTENNWKEPISFALRKYIDMSYRTNFLNGEYIKVGPMNDDVIKFIEYLDLLKFAPNKSGDWKRYVKTANKIVEMLRKEKQRGL